MFEHQGESAREAANPWTREVVLIVTQSTTSPPPNPHPEIVTVREAMMILRCTDRYLYGLIAAGDLPAYKLGGKKAIRLKRVDVEALLQPVGGSAA